MFTDHKKFAAAPPTGGVSAEEKQALVGEPVVYGLPAKPKKPVALVERFADRAILIVHGVEVVCYHRGHAMVSHLNAVADCINDAAAKEQAK